MMGTASSEVARNTATSVAGARKPAENSADAAAENPHWGMEPASAPTTGPNCAAREHIEKCFRQNVMNNF